MRAVEPASALLATGINFLGATAAVFARNGLIVVNVGFETRYIGGPEGYVSTPDAIIFYAVQERPQGEQGTRKIRVPLQGMPEITAKMAVNMVAAAIPKAVIMPFHAALEVEVEPPLRDAFGRVVNADETPEDWQAKAAKGRLQ